MHPWSSDFSTTDTGIDVQAVWIRLRGLPEGYYFNFLPRAIGQAIGPVIKLDTHTDFSKRGKFVRLVVCVDLKKLLAPKVKINGRTQRVEYEYLPNVCFNFGLYGHCAKGCVRMNSPSSNGGNNSASVVDEKLELQKRVEEEDFGLRKLVERRQRGERLE
ncbi:hypothetical protein GOBAR_DD13494 [Gossypium barbadense]|nr:hypothetical protein GOBAR_DD13494 [Gossypium barbadense]